MSKPIYAISIFSVDESSGHSVEDDLFYFGLFRKKKGKRFKFFAPPYSISKIEEKYGSVECLTQPIDIRRKSILSMVRVINSIPVEEYSRIVFLGYSEKFILFFCMLNFFKSFELVLVATNNICSGRISKYKTILKLIFAFIDRKLIRLVVHTEKEKELTAQLSNNLQEKTIVKKHHLMIPRVVQPVYTKNKKMSISFFGPEKHDKPLEPMLELIKGDVNEVFCYRLYNVSKEKIEQLKEIQNKSNIEFINKWLTTEEYYQEFSNSSLVLMSHDENYEGKLSGNLCDCISLGVPFISLNIEPVVSFNKKYLALGFEFDFSNPAWITDFLNKFTKEKYAKFKENLNALEYDYSPLKVEEDNASAILD